MNKLLPGAFPRALPFCALLLGATACGGGSGGGGATATPATTATITGTWTYEYPPTFASGLDYQNLKSRPIRMATVQMIKASDGSVLASGTTTDMGAYSIPFTGSAKVKIRVLAKIDKPSIQVEDNTNSNALWSADSAEITLDGKSLSSQNFVAKLNWGGESYSGPRTSAPFMILDTAYNASKQFMAVDANLSLAPLKVNWSPNNAPFAGENGDPAQGQLGGSFYNPADKELYILGKENIDTDEFDEHTLIHEWGHFFEANHSRSDSPGGHHAFGNLLDPSLAFGEGFGYGLAAMMLAPNATVIDASGPKQGMAAVTLDVDNPGNLDSTPGWFSETSVAAVLYDIFDQDNAELTDSVSLGLKPFYDVLVGSQKTTRAQTTIFSFLHALKQANPNEAGAIDTVAALRGIQAVQDQWGTGETNNGGAAYHLGVYHQMQIGQNIDVTLHGTAGGGGNASEQSNKLPANRLIRFTATATQTGIAVTTTAPMGANSADYNVQVVVYDGDRTVGTLNDQNGAGAEGAAFPTEIGKEYVARIQDLGNLQGTYVANVRLANP